MKSTYILCDKKGLKIKKFRPYFWHKNTYRFEILNEEHLMYWYNDGNIELFDILNMQNHSKPSGFNAHQNLIIKFKYKRPRNLMSLKLHKTYSSTAFSKLIEKIKFIKIFS